ncbi:L-2-amino-thiazoline-4-carboxylic acid hydrolase [Schaalia vaccimaxillae]|uniref:L-2-amino-thiazoline-4-carboxylic acid hydrolase n=1 Tax=Schaalia vaccimaxillae TaxID=183916 RepID=UPI0003B56F62|nr:L-2-amino-thiazoline-4-carboxylic acid hydrolase [Schaalia vaccimaxillae]
MSTQETIPNAIGDLPILLKREIEARALAPVYEIIKREFGQEKARSILSEAVHEHSVAEGRAFAAQAEGGVSMRTFIDIQDLWSKGGALDHDVLAASDHAYDYQVHNCAYADMYERLGLKEIGTILSCQRDYEFILGYDKDIVLERSPSIMMGNDHCLFRYRLRSEVGEDFGGEKDEPGKGYEVDEVSLESK